MDVLKPFVTIQESYCSPSLALVEVSHLTTKFDVQGFDLDHVDLKNVLEILI